MGYDGIRKSASAGIGTPATEPRYRAFISYSHADERAALSLHRWLETYKIPRHAVGKTTARGVVPKRLLPIFRDRNELPASDNLDQEVASALSESACLIVLCSPAAKASRWVEEEIRLYRALNPEGVVLAALIDGEPRDSFPATLAGMGADGVLREPIAADFRRQGDGTRLARLKIVAGITGIALDELVQRDAQRQIRRVIAVSVAALASTLLMGMLLVFALNARNEAEHQRAQAEGLIEFMLTDLRLRLQSVGRLDILTSVNERALGYYGEQGDLSRLPSNSLERRARVLHAMGEDDQRRGDFGPALSKFREAQRVTQALLADDPDDPARIFAHAQSEFYLGYTDFLAARYDNALPRFEAYLRLAQRLVRIAPGDPRYLRELSYAEGGICSLELARKSNPAASLKACGDAMAAMEAVERATPGDRDVRRDVANRHAWMADAYVSADRTGDALAERRRQNAMLDALVAGDPKNIVYRQDWMLARYSIATVLRDLGEAGQASAAAGEARTVIDQLTVADPENEDWQKWRKRIEKSFPETSKGEN
jgi:tetratricopeptide (TPR) repeat protein